MIAKWTKVAKGDYELRDGETMLGYVQDGDCGSSQHPRWIGAAFPGGKRERISPKWKLREAKEAVESRLRKADPS